MDFRGGRARGSLALSAFTPARSNGSSIRVLGRLVLGKASTLDAFRSYPLARGCPAVLCATGTLEAPDPRSSRTQGSFPSVDHALRKDTAVLSRDVLNPARVSL